MWWAIGIGGIFLYVLVAFTLGLMTLRNGHGWMFFLRNLVPDPLDLQRLYDSAGDADGFTGTVAPVAE
jgi:hypothetical protein